MEISQEIITKEEASVKINLADDISRLLQVRDKNKDMIKDWLLFLSTSDFKLTAGEIYLAFKMALSRELLDSKGNEIELFPELSINTTGKVLFAYLKYKDLNVAYQRSKDELRKLNKPKNDFSEKEKEETRNYFVKLIFDELNENKYTDSGWMIYDSLYELGKIKISNNDKKEMYNKQLKIHQTEEQESIRLKNPISSKFLLQEFRKKIDSGKPLIYVKNKCKNILVSQYLLNFINDFDEFKKEIPF